MVSFLNNNKICAVPSPFPPTEQDQSTAHPHRAASVPRVRARELEPAAQRVKSAESARDKQRREGPSVAAEQILNPQT